VHSNAASDSGGGCDGLHELRRPQCPRGSLPQPCYCHHCRYVYACMHACMHVCMYACMYIHTYICICVCTYTHTHTGYGDLKPQTDRGKLFTVNFVMLSLSAFGFVTSCIADAIFPDSDTSVGFGGTESEWGLSPVDKLLGRSGSKDDFSLSRSRPRRFRLFALVVAIVLVFSFLIMSLEAHMTYVDGKDAMYFDAMYVDGKVEMCPCRW
jgi:hypothetical protein